MNADDDVTRFENPLYTDPSGSVTSASKLSVKFLNKSGTRVELSGVLMDRTEVEIFQETSSSFRRFGP